MIQSEILPVHRLKVRWLQHRSLLFSRGIREFVEFIHTDWFVYGATHAIPELFATIDRLYLKGKELQKEFGV